MDSGDRAMSLEHAARHRHLSEVFAEELARNTTGFTAEQRSELSTRIDRLGRIAEQLEQAVVEFDRDGEMQHHQAEQSQGPPG